MKPALCALCGKSAAQEACLQAGDWVAFADHAAGEVGLGHPDGLEYFCAEHLAHAHTQVHLPAGDAVEVLKKQLA